MSLLAALIPVIALGTAPVAAVPPPPEQVAANCEAPTYASDMLVCADADLRPLDTRMREAWAAVDFASVVAQEAWVEAQDAWFRRRVVTVRGIQSRRVRDPAGNARRIDDRLHPHCAALSARLADL